EWGGGGGGGGGEVVGGWGVWGKELYGLEIVDEVLAMPRGKRRISLGGLYTTLHRMEHKNLVTSRWGETVDDRQGARRRYYKIAGLGARALTEAVSVLGPALRLAHELNRSS